MVLKFWFHSHGRRFVFWRWPSDLDLARRLVENEARREIPSYRPDPSIRDISNKSVLQIHTIYRFERLEIGLPAAFLISAR